MNTVAAVDCGTNSIRLLIAENRDGKLTDIVREMRIVRLGQGVDATGEFAPEALERTFVAAREYAGLCARHGVEKIRFAATSASRDAGNREDFFTGIRDIMGVTPEVIAGEEEATLSFTGAVSGVAGQAPHPVLVVDIGGGSTEFILGNDKILGQISTNMGSVRLRERFGLPDSEMIDEDAARTLIQELLGQAAQVIDFSQVQTLVGVAGTVTTVTARALGLKRYQPELIDGAVLDLVTVRQATTWLRETSVAEKATEGYMPPGRADVIGAGALIWQEIVDWVEAARPANNPLKTVVTSERDILDGIAMSLLGN